MKTPTLNEINKLCSSSYENPEHEIDGWHFFAEPFIPAINNLKLVGKLLAWKRGVDRYYVSIIGTPKGAFAYKKGDAYPSDVIDDCVIEAHFVMNKGLGAVAEEKKKAMDRLLELVIVSEKLNAGVVV